MDYRLIISERADEQLDNIIRYVADESQNQSAAAAILNDISAAYSKLSYMADSFAVCEDPYLASRGYRKYRLADHNYVILYFVDKETVYIAGIFHMREDYVRKL